jgi:hypothetical protein
MKQHIYLITNMYGEHIWQGEAYSFYAAWQKMFEATKTPQGADRSITIHIARGMWIEKLREV